MWYFVGETFKMKKITKPAEKEEAVYYSDFSGKCFGEFSPPIELKIEFNYGSGYDGSMLGFHLSDEDIKPIIDIIKKNISEDYKNFLRSKIEKYKKEYDVSVSFRDWDDCERIGYSVDLLKELLDIKYNE